MPAISRTKKILLCLSIWIIPLTTGSIAVAVGVMMPSGANWCWISASRTDLRYALTHAWRFAVILAIICIYGYVYYHTSRHFKSLAKSSTQAQNSMALHSRHDSVQKSPYAFASHQQYQSPDPQPRQEEMDFKDMRSLHGRSWLRLSNTPDEVPLPPPIPAFAKETNTGLKRPTTANTDVTFDDSKSRTSRVPARAGTLRKNGVQDASQSSRRVEREVKKMLLMNAYPILYVLLWIPGLVNRLLQATGQPPPSRVLDALQAAPVFIGFANAVTYGFNQHLRRKIASDFYYWRARRGWSRMKS